MRDAYFLIQYIAITEFANPSKNAFAPTWVLNNVLICYEDSMRKLLQ